jgi:limonene-1,2-epoxide hydrolase
MTRRTLFAAGGLGTAGLLAGAASAQTPSAETPPASAAETANLQLVKDFFAGMTAPGFDAGKLMAAFIAPDGKVRVLDTQPFVVGPAAAAAAMKPYFSHGEQVRVKFLSTFVRGPVVVTHRIDTMVAPGKPDQSFEMVGVFMVRDAKIKEWSDYYAG